MDTQQLCAIKGEKGFEHKVSVIHMRTRMKYSEIHSTATTKVCADVLERARHYLPPFFIVFTDNAMAFTMKYSAHPERKTAFEKKALEMGVITAQVPKGKPWKNGLIERSNRTDNEEFFRKIQFTSSDERKYLFRLWEAQYNSARPHQSLNMETPLKTFIKEYPIHAHLYNTS